MCALNVDEIDSSSTFLKEVSTKLGQKRENSRISIWLFLNLFFLRQIQIGVIKQAKKDELSTDCFSANEDIILNKMSFDETIVN